MQKKLDSLKSHLEVNTYNLYVEYFEKLVNIFFFDYFCLIKNF